MDIMRSLIQMEARPLRNIKMKKYGKRKAILAAGLLLLMILPAFPVRAEAAANTWVTGKGCRYYYDENGEKVKSRIKKIGNSRYFFDSRGRMVRKTMKVIRGKRYYFRSNGKAAVGWVNLEGKKYYFDSEGCGAKGLTEIDGKKYYFADDGTMQTGWQIIGKKKAYFYLKNGQMAVKRTINGQKIDKNGYAKLTHADKAEAAAVKRAAELLKTITNDSMSKSQKLRAAYAYMCSRSHFSHVTWRNFSVYDGWEYDYALEIYNRRGGNCYNFACGFAVMAKVIGYEPYVVRGRIHGTRDGAADGLTRHAYVRVDGLYYDPEAEFAGWASDIYAAPVYPAGGQVLGVRKI